MNPEDRRTIDIAARFLQSGNGNPVSERDYELAFLAGMILARGDGQYYEDSEISRAVTEAMIQIKHPSK